MITVRYSPSRHELKMEGHAGYDNVGKDIVCAAASMVWYNLCAVLLRFPEEAMKLELKDAGKKGVASVKAKRIKPEYEQMIDFAFQYALTGFQTLEGHYTEFIKLIITAV